MNSKRFSILAILGTLVSLGAVAGFNWSVDPYGFYGNDFFEPKKTQQINQLRLFKAIKSEGLKPTHVILGTSRAEFGYDPSHEYFTQPSYNLSVGGCSISEAFRYLKHVDSVGEVKRVLLICDFIMFNSNEQFKIKDFERYFHSPNTLRYLVSANTLRSSLYTLQGEQQKKYSIYNENGQREHTHNAGNLKRFGGQKKKMLAQANYFKSFNNDSRYLNSGVDAFEDFDALVRYCLENEVELDLVFGPNHALHWESLDVYIGQDKWYAWKKKVVLTVDRIAQELGRKAPRIVDFATYNPYTLDEIPGEKDALMKYHWELNHYRHELGDLVLVDLNLESPVWGKVLSKDNIDVHLEEQSRLRTELIDVERYREEVLEKRKPQDWNSYFQPVQ